MLQRLLQRAKAHPLILLFSVAVILRVLFLSITASQMTTDQIETLSPDTTDYTEAARQLLDSGTVNQKTVAIFGPGYSFFLYLVSLPFGWSPVYLLCVQVLLSSLCAVGIYWLARLLLDNERIALAAGYVYACNVLSISLASAFLSETLFTACLLGGLLLLFQPAQKRFLFSVICSAFLFTIAILTRSQGLFFPAFLLCTTALLLLVKNGQTPYGNKQLFKKVGACALTCYTIFALWTTYNTLAQEQPQVSRALPIACMRIGMHINTKQNQTTWGEEQLRFDSLLAEQIQLTGKTKENLFGGFATAYFTDVIRAKPIQSIRILFSLFNENIHMETGHLQLQLPDWAETVRRWEIFSNRKGLNYRATLFSLVGFFILWGWRKKQQAIMLASIYLYFAILSTFTLWQGNRIMYPAVIAWSMLIAVVLVWGFDLLRSRFKNERRNADTTLPRHDTGLPDAAR